MLVFVCQGQANCPLLTMEINRQGEDITVLMGATRIFSSKYVSASEAMCPI